MKKLNDEDWYELLIKDRGRSALLFDDIAVVAATALAKIEVLTKEQAVATVYAVWKQAATPNRNKDVASMLDRIAGLLTRPNVRRYMLTRQAEQTTHS